MRKVYGSPHLPESADINSPAERKWRNSAVPPASCPSPNQRISDIGELEEVRLARRCLMALRLEVDPSIANDVTRHVEDAFRAIRQTAHLTDMTG